MRRRPFLLAAMAMLAVPASAPASGSDTGGAAAPSSGGGMTYGQPLRRAVNKQPARPVARLFSVTPGTLAPGAPAKFAYRIDGRMSTVRVRIVLTRTGSSRAAKVLRLGLQLTGERHTYTWKPRGDGLAAGAYGVTLRAVDADGRRLRRTARASVVVPAPLVATPAPAPAAPVVSGGVFPVAGSFSFGGDDARFGAGREGHIHQGQDITAAEGTPIVAPVAATVYWIAYQAGGAGHYVVLRATDGRDLVFMHLETGSITVAEGDSLAAGTQFARVGSTGSSTGPHLHFEIWPDGWYSSKDSLPIDPLPQLIAWAGTR